MRRRWVLGAVCSLVLVGAVACGDDDSGSSSSSGGDDESSSEAEFEGDPVTIGSVINLLSPTSVEYVRAGIDAGVAAVNADGGIGGRRLEVNVCEHEPDPNDAAQCARELTTNDDVVALVANDSVESEAFDPILEDAGLASVGHSLYNSADFASPVVFPADGGTVSGIAAAGPICFNDVGGTSMSLLYADVGTAAQVVGILDNFVLAPFDTQLSAAVPFPLTASDLSSPAAEIVSDDADCVAVIAGAESSVQFVQALRQQGYEGFIFLPALVVSEQTLRDELDDQQIENVILVRAYDYDTALFEEFLGDLQADSGDDADALVSDHAVKAWLSIKIFAEVANSLDTVDRAAVLAALENLSFDTGGLLPEPLDYANRTADPDVLGGAAPNLIVPYAMGIRASDGEPVSGNFQNVFGGPDQ